MPKYLFVAFFLFLANAASASSLTYRYDVGSFSIQILRYYFDPAYGEDPYLVGEYEGTYLSTFEFTVDLDRYGRDLRGQTIRFPRDLRHPDRWLSTPYYIILEAWVTIGDDFRVADFDILVDMDNENARHTPSGSRYSDWNYEEGAYNEHEIGYSDGPGVWTITGDIPVTPVPVPLGGLLYLFSLALLGLFGMRRVRATGPRMISGWLKS